MAQKIFLAVLLLLLGAIGVWVFLPGANTPQSNLTSTTTAEALAQASPIAPNPEPAQEPSPLTLDRQAAELPNNPKQKYGTPAAAEEDGILVSVIDSDSQKPLPKAEVMVLDTRVANMQLFEAEMNTRSDFEHVFLELGITYTTNQKGQVRIPTPVGDLFLAGRTPTHFDFAFNLEEKEGKILLPLHPVVLLPTKVVNSAKQPVEGVVVALRARTEILLPTPTDANGMAYLRIFHLMQQEFQDEEVYITLQILSAQPIEQKFSFNPIPEEPVLFTLPKAGDVQVEVVDAEGNLDPSPYYVGLEIVPDASLHEQDASMQTQEEENPSLAAQTKDGIAYFPLVAFNQTVKVSVIARDQEKKAFEVGAGPTAAYPHTLFRLQPQVEQPILHGTIVLEDGSSLPHTQVSLTVQAGTPFRNSQPPRNLKTDADGGFRIPLSEPYAQGQQRRLRVEQAATPSRPMRVGFLDLSFPISPGEQNLGKVVLQVPPLLVAGRVTNMQQQAVGGVVLVPERSRENDTNNSYRWGGLWDLRQKSQRDGSFEIRGFVDEGDFRLRAQDPNYVAQWIPFEKGMDHLDVVMQTALSLEGQFLLDPILDTNLLQVGIRHPDPRQNGKLNTWYHGLESSGAFEFSQQPSGLATLILRSRQFGQIFFEQEVQLEPTAENRFILDPIDLRGRIPTASLFVLNELGEQLLPVTLSQPKTWWSYNFKQQPIVLAMAPNGVELQVAVEGFRKQTVHVIPGTQTITLKKSIPIHLIINNQHLLPAGFVLSASLQPTFQLEGTDKKPRGARIAAFTAKGADVTVPMPGQYELQFGLEHADAQGRKRIDLAPGPSPTIKIEDLGGRQFFQIDLPTEVIEFALGLQ